jgi:hypothetical protein
VHTVEALTAILLHALAGSTPGSDVMVRAVQGR